MLERANTRDLYIELAKVLGQQTDFQEVLRLVAQKSSQFLNDDLSLILMLNPDTRETIKTVMREGRHLESEEYRNIHIHVGGWIVSKGKSFLSKEIQKDDRFAEGLFEDVPMKAVLGVPLIVEGLTIGALMLLYRDSSSVRDPESLHSLENIAAVSAPFLRNTQKIRQFFESALPETTLLSKYQSAGLLGKSPRFVELLRAIEAATKCDVRVLLDGKTGTGKELVARAIHMFSPRGGGPFIAMDCGAIPATLIESELFGHKKGAFTGAHANRRGLLLEANGGTLFMDEINNLPLEMQPKLLRVLEEGEVRPVGSDKAQKTDVRIIAASSVSLRQLVEKREFREDLFFRLHVYPIRIPDLCERNEDIALLANHFLEVYSAKQNKKAVSFHEEVIDFMRQRTWHGHIRELENLIESVVTVISPDVESIDSSFLPLDVQREFEEFRLRGRSRVRGMPLKEQLDNYEAELIKKALIACDWNQSEAARTLQTSEGNIRYKMSHLNIHRDA